MHEVYINIKKRRKALGMTQAELAEKCGYKDHTTINAIEHGKVDCSLDRLLQIASVLDIDLAVLLGYKEVDS